MTRSELRHVVLLSMFVLFVTKSSAQDIAPIRIDVDLVQVVATVVDSQGRYVKDLGKDEFLIDWNGMPQQIAHFTRDAETPVSLGLLIDTSGSMRPRLQAAQQAASAFVRGMRPADEFFVMTFARRARLIQNFTSDRDRLDRALHRLGIAFGSTHLEGAVEKAADKVRTGRQPKRALVVISDGGGVSAAGIEKFQDRLRNAEVLMYAIELMDEKQRRFLWMREPSPGDRTRVMHAVAEETGARWFGINASLSSDQLLSQFDETFAQISSELRGQYSIGFYPSESSKLSPERIRVRVKNPDFKVRIQQRLIRAK